MRRKLALLLAVVMTITMMPSSVFAGSSNSVSSVKYVSKTHLFTRTDAPNLNIEMDDEFSVGDKFRMTFTNAKIYESGNNGGFLWAGNLSNHNDYSGKGDTWMSGEKHTGEDKDDNTFRASFSTRKGGSYTFDIERISATVVEFTYVQRTGEFDSTFSIPLTSKVTGAGDVKVAIESRGSAISSGSYTYAIAGSGETKASVADTTDIEDKATKLEDIMIDETRIGAIGDISSGRYLEIKAPTNFDLKLPVDNDITYAGGFSGYESKIQGEWRRHDDHIVRYYFTSTAKFSDATSMGSIVISNLTITPTDDARTGDVYLTISGSAFTTESILVGTYKEYDVTFSAEDKELPVLFSGRFEGAPGNSDADGQDSAETLEVVLEETLPSSWVATRKTEFTTQDGVKIRAVDFEVDDVKAGFNVSDVMFMDKKDNKSIPHTTPNGTVTARIDDYANNSKFTISGIETEEDEKASITMTFYLSISPEFEGDVKITASGPALLGNEYTVTVAKAIKPVTVTSKQNDVEIGYKNVAINDITISENAPGAILKKVYGESSSSMSLFIGDPSQNDTQYFTFATFDDYEVTAGDIVIDKVNIRNGYLNIYVKSESDKASTIVIKGITINIDRTPPEGYYSLSAGIPDSTGSGRNSSSNGITKSAILSNYDDSPEYGGYFDVQAFVTPRIFNIITAAPGSQTGLTTEATFTFVNGEASTAIVGSDTKVINPAAYIDTVANRTMIPLRSASVALGIPDNNIGWDATSRTASVQFNNKIASVVVAGYGMEPNRTLYVNGVAYKQMDIAPVIKDDSTFLPIGAFADALSINYLWDQATRTLVFNPSSDSIAKYPNAELSWNRSSGSTVATETTTAAETTTEAETETTTEATTEETTEAE